MRKRIIIPLLFFLFLAEGLLIPLLSKTDYGFSFSIYPRLVLVTLIYIAIYHRRRDALLLALFFGVLTDLIFGRVYGVYTISLMGVIFLCIALVGSRHISFLYYLFVQLVALASFEIFIFGLLKIYQLATMHFFEMVLYVLLPTVLFNLLLAALFYPLLNRIIGKENI